jgi:hypothetical protein
MNWLKGKCTNIRPEDLKKTLCYGPLVWFDEEEKSNVYIHALGFPLIFTLCGNGVIVIESNDPDNYVLVDVQPSARNFPLTFMQSVLLGWKHELA